MKKRERAQILENIKIGGGIQRIRLHAPEIADTAKPGQFVNLYLPQKQFLLPRPFGVADADGQAITLYYMVVGQGTELLSEKKSGHFLDILGPNGNGYDLSAMGEHILLASGGTGIPSLLFAARRLRELIQKSDSSAKKITAVTGFRDTAFLVEEISKYCDQTFVISETDGTQSKPLGMTGNILNLFFALEAGSVKASGLDKITGCLSCGPMPMLRAMDQWCGDKGIALQVCLEARMGCGMGACVGCTCETTVGKKKICVDGPVFDAKEVCWV
ncbi:MAG: dihydroorotate dehydrogenase electron transfer subunit [Clostridiales Family XIII bacterium]|jgi:dihydroorotate dehydrogenase electron transfer subunit|nr:dihydroorotate dehydrogenase electron transfer subunit [Clostridiales Family XIII bacterium]